MAFDRRSLLITSSLWTTSVAVGCDDKTASNPAPEKNNAKNTAKTAPLASKRSEETMLATLEAIADRIVPPEPALTGPRALGAKALGAKAYFAKVLDDKRLIHLRRPLQRGVDFLNRGAKLESKAEGFSALSAADQDAWLERLNADKVRPNGIKGSQFLRLMVALTMESCLGAPEHGGNANKAAWEWLNYSELGRGGIPT